MQITVKLTLDQINEYETCLKQMKKIRELTTKIIRTNSEYPRDVTFPEYDPIEYARSISRILKEGK